MKIGVKQLNAAKFVWQILGRANFIGGVMGDGVMGANGRRLILSVGDSEIGAEEARCLLSARLELPCSENGANIAIAASSSNSIRHIYNIIKIVRITG